MKKTILLAFLVLPFFLSSCTVYIVDRNSANVPDTYRNFSNTSNTAVATAPVSTAATVKIKLHCVYNGTKLIFYENDKQVGYWLSIGGKLRKYGKKISGVFTIYDKYGKVMGVMTFKNNYRDGLYKRYNKYGVIVETGRYKRGNHTGIYYLYDKKGRIYEKGAYDGGRRHIISRNDKWKKDYEEPDYKNIWYPQGGPEYERQDKGQGYGKDKDKDRVKNQAGSAGMGSVAGSLITGKIPETKKGNDQGQKAGYGQKDNDDKEKTWDPKDKNTDNKPTGWDKNYKDKDDKEGPGYGKKDKSNNGKNGWGADSDDKDRGKGNDKQAGGPGYKDKSNNKKDKDAGWDEQGYGKNKKEKKSRWGQDSDDKDKGKGNDKQAGDPGYKNKSQNSDHKSNKDDDKDKDNNKDKDSKGFLKKMFGK